MFEINVSLGRLTYFISIRFFNIIFYKLLSHDPGYLLCSLHVQKESTNGLEYTHIETN